MKVQRLESRIDGSVAVVIVMASGEEAEVNFTIDRKFGDSFAIPDQPIFNREYMDAADTRAIITAVIAFNAVAIHSSVVPVYDEAHIARKVSVLDRRTRTLFSAACAERLWPLLERYAFTISMVPERLELLRRSLDAVWNAGTCGDGDLAAAQAAAEGLVPEEDDEWVMESGYAQNAIAAIAYAARSWLANDSREAVWAARQVYEAADYAAQQEDLAGGGHIYTQAVEFQISTAPVVGAAVQAIYADLEAVVTEPAEVVRARVRAASIEFVRHFP